MKMIRMLVGAAALMGSASMASATEAPVANLLDANGKILVDHGQGFVLAVGSALQAGDRIFIGDKSSATVAYAECRVKLAKPIVFIVGKTAPCVKGANAAQAGSVFIAPTADAPAGAGAAGAGAGGAGAGGAGAGAGGAGAGAGAGGFAGLGPLLLLPPAILGGAFFILTASKK